MCLICLVCLEGVGPGSIRKLMRAADEQGRPLRHLIGLPRDDLADGFGLRRAAARAIAAVQDPVLAGEALLQHLGLIGARPIFDDDADYPEKLARFLGRSAPPVLFVCGEPGILRSRSIGVVGSRRPTSCARDAAARFARAAAAAGRTIVSGAAAGIDTVAHRAALRAGGTAFVPALGIARFRWRGVDAAEGRWCVVGQFRPDGRWSSRYALIRNRTIVALSDAVVAFEPRDTGGTWHSSLAALHLGKPLFVVTCAAAGAKGRGLEKLVRLGGQVLDARNMPAPEAFDRLVSEYEPPPRPSQLPLFEPPEDW